MRKKLSIILACMMLITSVSVNAATTVQISRNGKKTKYSGVKKSVKVNNKTVSLSSVPIFVKDGANVGPVNEIFANSSLKVRTSSLSNQKTITLTYGEKVLVLKEGSKKATINKKATTVASAPIHATYTSSKKARWIVPIYSVCDRLGLNYSTSGGTVSVKHVHSWGSYKTTKEASCKYSGTKERTCSVCKETETVSIPALGHKWGSRVKSGNTTKYTCSRCGETKTEAAKKMKIVIDAGHGGNDSGATGNGLKEKTLNLEIVKAAQKYFNTEKAKAKYEVSYTRTTDVKPSLDARYALANSKKADLFISIHINCSDNKFASGTETLYSAARSPKTGKNNITSYKLAAKMQQYAKEATGFTNRGLKNRPNIKVLKYTNMPSCLIEWGFISNKSDAAKMKINANKTKYGKAIYDGVENLTSSYFK